MLGMYFTDQKVYNFENAETSDLERFTAFYKGMPLCGKCRAPSQIDGAFASAARTAVDIDETFDAAA